MAGQKKKFYPGGPGLKSMNSVSHKNELSKAIIKTLKKNCKYIAFATF